MTGLQGRLRDSRMYHQQETVRATVNNNNNDVRTHIREHSPATEVYDTHPYDWGTTKNECDTTENDQTHTMDLGKFGGPAIDVPSNFRH